MMDVVETVQASSPPTPSPSVRHVVWMAGKKLLKMPTTYASFLGLLWSLIAFRFGIKMPKVVDDSLFLIYTTAIGLSIVLFRDVHSAADLVGSVRLRRRLSLRCSRGPVVMLIASLALGIRGTLLRFAVVQVKQTSSVT